METDYTEILANRFRKFGLGEFHNQEVLGLLLSLVLPEQDCPPLVKTLIKQYKGLRGVLDAPIEELNLIKGMNKKAAIQLKLAKDISIIYLKEQIIKKDVLKNQQDVINFLTMTLSSEKTENFFSIYMNKKNEIIEMERITEGGISHTVVNFRRVIEGAFRHGASSIILVHNHPSGDPTPSQSDLELTRKLSKVASAVNISILDHIIIGKNTSCSVREHENPSGFTTNFSRHRPILPHLLHE